MSRSPFAYPLTRGIEGDSGGAADLQTDVMRFMAILSLCLVAIFALVQSLPMEPTPPPREPQSDALETVPVPAEPVPPPVQAAKQAVQSAPTQQPPPEAAKPVQLTRPKWVPQFTPTEKAAAPSTEAPPPTRVAAAAAPGEPAAIPPPPEPQGFTLRFESDLALTRLVAIGQVGFYAIESGSAQRMSVAESRISFWSASTPKSFHEMESGTVPGAVIDALSRTGANPRSVQWGVTLPGRMRTQLDTYMRDHRGGSLVIQADGNLELEAS